MAYWKFPRYVTVGEKRAKADRTLKKLKKKNPDIQPIVIEGRTLGKTWWGRAWNENLERYADYANRIGRGRTYVRHGAVLDLRIAPGLVSALVQGSTSRPYTVTITIKPLAKKTWKEIKAGCTGRFESLQDLLAGKFPKALSEIFTARGKGLFPSPAEITLDCSCPDWAEMCKHVAAVLYGIGARLDEDPALFFRLRKVRMEDLVAEAMEETTGKLLEKAEKKTGRVIADADLENVFGIVMEDRLDYGGKKSPKPLPDSTPRKPIKQPRAAVSAGKKKTAPADDKTLVLDVVLASRTGVTVPTLCKRTGLNPVKVRNIIYKAHKEGIIERAGRGVYTGKIKRSDPVDETKTILALIKKSKNGIAVSDIKKRTEITDVRVRNILSRAYAAGTIERPSRGTYAWKRVKAPPVKASDVVLGIIGRSVKGVSFSLIRKKSGLDDKTLRNIIFRLSKPFLRWFKSTLDHFSTILYS